VCSLWSCCVGRPGSGGHAGRGWISTKPKLALLTTEGVRGTAIHVDAILGKHTLHGKVRCAEEKAKAESIAPSLC